MQEKVYVVNHKYTGEKMLRVKAKSAEEALEKAKNGEYFDADTNEFYQRPIKGTYRVDTFWSK